MNEFDELIKQIDAREDDIVFYCGFVAKRSDWHYKAWIKNNKEIHNEDE